MPSCRFTDFDVTIRGQEPPYSATARWQGQSAEGAFEQHAVSPYWQAVLGALDTPHQRPGRAFLAAAGVQLYSALMQGDVRDLWVRARAATGGAGGTGLRLRLALRPPAVAALPWEALCEPHRDEFLAATAAVTLVRSEDQARYVAQTRSLAAERPVRLLLVAPDDPTGQVDAAAHLAALRHTLEALPPGYLALLPPLTGRVSRDDLRRRIEAGAPELLHIVSHGQPGGLLCWRGESPDLLSAAALRALLALPGAAAVRLVLLTACNTGRLAADAPLSAVGPELLKAGVPAVIAMQFEITDAAAARFATSLYQELTGGACPGQVDVAVSIARNSLYFDDTDSFAFGTPALWLNAPDGMIFDLTPSSPPGAQAESAPPPLPPAAPAAEPLPEPPDLDEVERWLSAQGDALAELALPLEVRTMRDFDWLPRARELHTLLQQVRSLHRRSEPDTARQLAEKYAEVARRRSELAVLARHIRELADSGPTAGTW